ncbi:MAG: hypothetical protein WAN14_23365, partial [Candidatus Acidiferrales bacterium]
RGQNTTRGGSDPIAPQNRGPIPPGFGGHSRLFLLEAADRVLAACIASEQRSQHLHFIKSRI